MNWLEKLAPNFLQSDRKKISVPEGVWHKCPQCKETIYSKDLIKNFKVCTNCGFHFLLTAEERIKYTVDPDSFSELFKNISSLDPIKFSDSRSYPEKIKKYAQKTGLKDAIITGTAQINKKKLALGVLDFAFMGGSMGSVMGEKITRLIEVAIEQKIPLVIISTSGGARMQEGTFSLMQMAKTSLALNMLKKERLPYISVIANPTTGGVSASFATLGDIIIAEPGALIGFAGPRVIKQTIKQELPEGFQRAEFQIKHGGIDAIVPRTQIKNKLAILLDHLTSHRE